MEGCKIAIMDLSDSSYGLPKCDVKERCPYALWRTRREQLGRKLLGWCILLHNVEYSYGEAVLRTPIIPNPHI